jgi:hypothetical protein
MKRILLNFCLLFLFASTSTIAQEYFHDRSGLSPAYGSTNVNYFNMVDQNDNRLLLSYFDFDENRFSYIANEYQFYFENNDNRSNKSYTLPRISTTGGDTVLVINSWVENGNSKLQIHQYYDITDDGSYFNQQNDRLYQSNNRLTYSGSSISGDGKYVISGGVRYTFDDELNITSSDSLPSNLLGDDEFGEIEFRDNFAIHQMNHDGSRYSIIKTSPKEGDASGDTLVTRVHYFAYDEANSIWHEGRISVQHLKYDLFEPTFDHDFGTLRILNSNGLHELNLADILDNVISASPNTSQLLQLSEAFTNGAKLYPDLSAVAYSGDHKIKFELTRQGQVKLYGQNATSTEYEFIKEFWGIDYPDATFNGYKIPVSLKTNFNGSLLIIGSLELGWSRNEYNNYYTNYLYNIDQSKPYIESFVSTNNALVFEFIFSEEVYDVGSESFYATLDGVQDENKLSVRSVNRIDNERFQISFRTNSGEVTGDIAIGINDSSKIVDRYQNPAADSTVTPISVQNFDALTSVIVLPDDIADLTKAIEYAGSSDTLHLNEGVYVYEGNDIRNKDITIRSDYDPSNDNQEAVLNTIISGNIRFLMSSITLTGLTFENGRLEIYGNDHGGDSNKKPATFKFQFNNYFNNTRPIRVEQRTDVHISNNLFHQNQNSALQLSYGGVSGVVEDNLFVYNEGYEGGAISIDDSDVLILHNLIANNKSRDYVGGGIYLSRSFSSLINNIIWGNQAFRGDQIFQGEGLPFIDHSIVQNYGQGANVLAREGDNIYTEDPGLEISYEPITAGEGKSVINRFGLYVSISDSSMIFGNGRSTDFDRYAMQTRVPIPFDSDADIGPFELEFAMVVNPIKATQLVYPLEADENPGVDPLFEWEPVRYSTAYEMMISPKEDFSENVSTHKSDRHFMSLDNPLDSSHEKYYWKVRGINATKKGVWSQTHMFNVGVINSNELMEEITEYQLSQNYPNPFNPSTQIQYALPEATQVTLEVFNSVGQKVMELVNGQKSVGYHTATFDASGLSSGVYLYKLTTPSFTETKKMLLIK